MDYPTVDSYCNFFAQIFWHLLGLYDLMLEVRETVENIHTYIHTDLSPTFGAFLIMNNLVVLYMSVSICTQDSETDSCGII